jgi:hypothetical protein
VINQLVATARVTAVISSPDLGVFAVAAAGVLCAFWCLVDALPEQCLRRRSDADPLFDAVFRTNWLLCERCSATCHRRRGPGQARRRQGRLQITAVLDEFRLDGDQDADRADLGVLRACGLVGLGGAIRVPGASALLTRNLLVVVTVCRSNPIEGQLSFRASG